jgi:hypothetical protein
VRVSTRISNHRLDKHTIRCRPGSFEWRYAKRQSALFHAGNQFARLWETAGVTIASSANYLRGVKSGYHTGIPEGRLQAIQTLNGVVSELGRFSTERLIDYCVLGHTTAEIARRHEAVERDMAAVIDHDLRCCADVLRYS